MDGRDQTSIRMAAVQEVAEARKDQAHIRTLGFEVRDLGSPDCVDA